MSEHSVNLVWSPQDGIFERGNYNRDHTMRFGAQILSASAASSYGGNSNCADPEQMLLAALCSCHMLTFLAVAANRGYIVDSYEDTATALLDKNSEGKIAVVKATLMPTVWFAGEKKPTEEEFTKLHERAHVGCFIANSIKTKVEIQAKIG